MKARRRGLGNVTVIHGDCMAEIPPESIDMALLYDVLHIDPGPDATRRILSSIHRVLKPRGVLSVTDHHLADDELVPMATGGGLFRFGGRTWRTLSFEKELEQEKENG